MLLTALLLASGLGISPEQNAMLAPATDCVPDFVVNNACDQTGCYSYCGLYGVMGPVKIRPGYKLNVSGSPTEDGFGDVFRFSGHINPDQMAVLWMAGAEYEGVQLVVSPGTTLNNVRVSAGGFTDASGRMFPGTIRLYREGTVDISCISGPDAYRLYPEATSLSPPGAGPWPDIMIPARDDEYYDEPRNAFPVTVGPGADYSSVVTYIEFFAPWGARGGPYNGKITVTWESAGSARSATIPFAVRLFDFDLPSEKALPTPYGYSMYTPAGIDAICNGHFSNPADQYCTTNQEALALLDKQYRALLLRHRISPDPHFTTGVSAGGYNFAAFDSAYQCYLANNPEALVAFAPPWAPFEPGSDTRAALYTAWNDHFTGANWDRMFDYTCDEPLSPNTRCPATTVMPSRLNTVAQGNAASGKNLPRAVTTSLEHATGYANDIDILIPLVTSMRDQQSAATQLSSWLQSGTRHRLWWYQSCVSHDCLRDRLKDDCTADKWESRPNHNDYSRWPNYTIDASAVQNRAMPWLAFAYGSSATGGPQPAGISTEYYWDTTAAYLQAASTTWNPWADLYHSGGNGDGTLTYPGRPSLIGGTAGHHIPLASLRLKMIRDGIDDYFIFRAAEALGLTWPDGSTVRDHVRTVMSEAAHSTGDPRMMLYTRMDVGFKLSARLSSDPYNCGAIGNVCNGTNTTCTKGKCSTAGTRTYSRCVGACCPWTTTSCGEDGRVCVAPSNGTPKCDAGVGCAFTCNAGYYVCNDGTACCLGSAPTNCPASAPFDCCGDGSACMAVRSKCGVVACY